LPEACVIDHEHFSDQVLRAARHANAIVAVGTCASFGGIPSARNNPTGAVAVPAFLAEKNVSKPVIALPGCPVHPDWLNGTIIHVLKFGLPELDEKQRPKMFYSTVVHDQCPRFADYERENFAERFSDPGCLFKLGCLGINTHADCTTRLWNAGTNSCIKSGAPCIGCAWEEFAHDPAVAFYRQTENQTNTDPAGERADHGHDRHDWPGRQDDGVTHLIHGRDLSVHQRDA
jgi:hydrogenase small subunit